MLIQLVSLKQGNLKKLKNWWISTEEENINIFWTIWEISMKYSGKMWLKIILKVIKSRLHPRSEKYIFGKTTEEEVEYGGQFDQFRVKVKNNLALEIMMDYLSNNSHCNLRNKSLKLFCHCNQKSGIFYYLIQGIPHQQQNLKRQ